MKLSFPNYRQTSELWALLFPGSEGTSPSPRLRGLSQDRGGVGRKPFSGCASYYCLSLPSPASSSFGDHKLLNRVLVTEWWSWAGACSWAKSINMIMNTKQNVKNGWKNRCYWCFWQASAAVAEASASRGKSFGGNWWQQGQEFLFVLFLQAFQETLSNFISRKNTVK